MIIEPNLERNQKFRALRRAVGKDALYFLMRVWAHCQEDQRGAHWGKVDSKYIEAVCDWSGTPGKLYELLTTSIVGGKKPFIEVRGGRVVVHEWDKRNQSLINSWKNGNKGGRPRVTNGEPTANPRVTHGQPTANPIREDKSREEDNTPMARFREIEVPGWDEFWAFADMQGLPEWRAKREFGYQQGRTWRGITNWKGQVSHIREIWKQEGCPKDPPPLRGSFPNQIKKGETFFEKSKRCDAMQKIVEQHPGRPNRAESGDPTKEEAKDYREKVNELARMREEIVSSKPK